VRRRNGSIARRATVEHSSSGAFLAVIGVLLVWPIPAAARPAPLSVPPPAVEARPVPLEPTDRRPVPVEPPTGPPRDAAVPSLAEGLSVAIDAPTAESDVGVPIPLEANVSGGAPPYQVTWNDSLGAWAYGSLWSINVSLPEPVEVRATVADSIGDVAESSLGLSFLPGPSLSMTAVPAAVDVNGVFALQVTVAGGVAPLELSWALSDGGPNGTATVAAGAPFAFPATVERPGPVVASATVLDAAGTRSVLSETVAYSYASPSLELGPSPAFAEVGASFDLRGVVVGGAPPVEWTLLPSTIVSGSSPDNGTIGPNGSFDWHAQFDAPGNATIAVGVSDLDGANASVAVPVEIVPALSVRVLLPTSLVEVDSTLNLTAVLSGGYPPYEWSLSAGDATGPAGEAAGPGNLSIQIPIGNESDLDVALSVTDALGAVVTVPVMLATLPPATDPGLPTSPAVPPSPLGEAATPAAVALAVVTLAALLVSKWRRHRAAVATDPAEVLQVVERLLLVADGVDLATLRHRGEVEGLEHSEVDRAVAELRRTGRLTNREDFNGEPLLVLSPAGSPAPPEAVP
jgi:hypothetical protein